ncbi:hypothetical protein PDIDSM_1858 [Penicillium digitatum]|nr:hypothetical protein PDIDSM_1858 [Penicillium digitatum]
MRPKFSMKARQNHPPCGWQESWSASHQGASFISTQKVYGTDLNSSGMSNGPTADFVAAAALGSVVAVNGLGTQYGTLLERFDICTA